MHSCLRQILILFLQQELSPAKTAFYKVPPNINTLYVIEKLAFIIIL